MRVAGRDSDSFIGDDGLRINKMLLRSEKMKSYFAGAAPRVSRVNEQVSRLPNAGRRGEFAFGQDKSVAWGKQAITSRYVEAYVAVIEGILPWMAV